MLDVALLRRRPEEVEKGLAAKGETANLRWFLQQDKDFRQVVTELQEQSRRQNELSRAIGEKRRAGADDTAERDEVAELKAKHKLLSERKTVLEEDLKRILVRLPNLPAEDVPVGPDASGNVVESEWGERPTFPFEPKPHWELGAALGMFDAERAAKISGSGFSLLTGPLAQLERALWNYMLDLHTREHGYTEVAGPYLVRPHSLEGCGQLPKLEEEMYRCRDDELFLIPTAEVPLTNLHRQEVLEERDLPRRYASFSPCFRREAGAAGRDTRGLIRMHQFHKVELMVHSLAEQSDEELLRIRSHAEAVLRNLKLPYRVVLLCTGDLSFASRKTYDLELWAPGVGQWLEVSSVSTFGDFQARRAGIRVKREKGNEFVHTLNGSGVALPRLVIAVVETYQREDGSIGVPEVLRPYMGWRDSIGPPGAA